MNQIADQGLRARMLAVAEGWFNLSRQYGVDATVITDYRARCDFAHTASVIRLVTEAFVAELNKDVEADV